MNTINTKDMKRIVEQGYHHIDEEHDRIYEGTEFLLESEDRLDLVVMPSFDNYRLKGDRYTNMKDGTLYSLFENVTIRDPRVTSLRLLSVRSSL